jgi:Cdc6-like AAA superfamily ATPase
MNFENIGDPIALLVNTKDKKKNRVLSIGNPKDIINPFNEFQISNEHEHFQQIPNKHTERNILYVTGSSGSGKSYYTSQYIKEYKKIYPKRDIYLFSSVGDDAQLDKLKVKRIKLNNDLLNETLTAQDFKDCLVIFDDTDAITNKNLKNKVNQILDSILQTGRHYNVSCVLTFHTATGGRDTKMILNEAHSITIFPHNIGGRSSKYLLDGYLGLDKHEINGIKKNSSRWVTILKTYPKIVLSDKLVYTL